MLLLECNSAWAAQVAPTLGLVALAQVLSYLTPVGFAHFTDVPDITMDSDKHSVLPRRTGVCRCMCENPLPLLHSSAVWCCLPGGYFTRQELSSVAQQSMYTMDTDKATSVRSNSLFLDDLNRVASLALEPCHPAGF